MTALRKTIPDAPWQEWAKRIILHVPYYMSYDGSQLPGGRQRNVRDLALTIKGTLGRDCVVVQKTSIAFEREDAHGISVIGVKVPLGIEGDSIFGYRSASMVGNGDAIIYMGLEDAWPFFVKNAKGYHVGVWWDGPYNRLLQMVAEHRVLSFVHRCKSVLSVDTNVINWVRSRGKRGYRLAQKMVYIPNYADSMRFHEPLDSARPHSPIRILWARRYTENRGPRLFLKALEILKDTGFSFRCTMSIGIDHENGEFLRQIRHRGLADYIEIVTHNLDTISDEYQKADVSVIPTLWSEGTSFSCVESIASGIPVIVTAVGGLGNLVIPGFNGIVISPDPSSLAEAIKEVSNTETWQELNKGCLSLRKCLSKEIWHERVVRWLCS